MILFNIFSQTYKRVACHFIESKETTREAPQRDDNIQQVCHGKHITNYHQINPSFRTLIDAHYSSPSPAIASV
jgi:hypothetical protein